ncbi:MAG: hypothetical protein IJM79_02400 [Erysipelotrichaceae bacterium]|nr:hypothetical protein [Erysipelotrichaceae bacterium]
MNRIKILSAVLALILLAGCQPVRESTWLAVLNNPDGKGEVMYIDENLKQIASLKCDRTEYAVQCGDVVYLSADGSDYQGYFISLSKKANRLENVQGELLYGFTDGNFVCQKDGEVSFFANGKKVLSQSVTVQMIGAYGEELFIVDQSLCLHCYDASTLQEKSVSRLSQDEYVGFIEADGKYCLVSRGGISVLKDGKVDTTYVYPLAFDELENCLAGRIFVYEGEELVVYKVAFSGHSLKLDLEPDERYYREINIDELFSSRIAQSASLVFFTEAEN